MHHQNMGFVIPTAQTTLVSYILSFKFYTNFVTIMSVKRPAHYWTPYHEIIATVYCQAFGKDPRNTLVCGHNYSMERKIPFQKL